MSYALVLESKRISHFLLTTTIYANKGAVPFPDIRLLWFELQSMLGERRR